MSTFSENMKRQRFERHMTQEEFAKLLGTTKQNVSRYESGAVSPKISTAAKIAELLGISLSELNGETKAVLLQDNEATLVQTKRIPILGDTAAGLPIIANREYDEYIDVPMDGRHFDAAVRVRGNSMSPKFEIGDLALIRYQDDVLDGEIAVVCLDDTVTLKRLYHTPHGIMLYSDNPAYKPMTYSNEDVQSVHLAGRVVGCIHWEE